MNNIHRRSLLYGLTVALFAALSVASVTYARVLEPQVTLCHATSSINNPYIEITVSGNAIANLTKWLNGHGGHEDDIWPDFSLNDGTFIAAQGNQSILVNGCEVLLEPTATSIPTSTLVPPMYTPTDVPTNTATSVPTDTSTSVPTATDIPTSTSIPPTDTVIPPTMTDMPTATQTPTDTVVPTDTPTNTLMPPTSTSVPPTFTPTDMPTVTPRTPMPMPTLPSFEFCNVVSQTWYECNSGIFGGTYTSGSRSKCWCQGLTGKYITHFTDTCGNDLWWEGNWEEIWPYRYQLGRFLAPKCSSGC